MNRNLIRGLAATVCFASFCAPTSAQTLRSGTYQGWDAWTIENEFVRLQVVPDIGGRVIQYSLGQKEFLWVNPALRGQTSPQTGLAADGTWLNYGGDKLWPAPQGWDNARQWPGPPDAVLDGQPYTMTKLPASRTGVAGLELTSREDKRSGIRFSRTIRLLYACNIGGDFPILSCTEAGVVAEPLEASRAPAGWRLRGRFGVFTKAAPRLEWRDTRGRVLGASTLRPRVTPLEPLLLDEVVDAPAGARAKARRVVLMTGTELAECPLAAE